MDGCVFCKIIKKEIPAEIVYETDDVLAFNDIKPSAPIHVLIIPKKHVLNLSEAIAVDEGLVDDVMMGVTKVAEEMGVADGYRATTNNGEKAGQMVPHFHFHLMGGWNNKEEALKNINK